MGFKRTTEGRIFFQNMDDDNGTAKSERPLMNKSAPQSAPKQTGGDNMQLQILALLKSLNDKLQDTQADRKKMHKELETYKMMVMNLQDKAEKQEKESKHLKESLGNNSQSMKRAEQAEQLSKEAFTEFEEARRLLAEIEEKSDRTEDLVKKQQTQVMQVQEQTRVKWDDLKKSSKRDVQALLDRVSKTEEAQKKLDERIEETAITTLKLDRKLEKAVQDRSRLIRKLERIEDTVLQTNEAMNARAMVLLTDQNAAAQSGMGHAPATGNDKLPEEEQYFDVPWWKKPMRMQATSVSLVVLTAALLGWGISEVQKPDSFSFDFEMPSFVSGSDNGFVQAQNTNDNDDFFAATSTKQGENDFTASSYDYSNDDDFGYAPIEQEEIATAEDMQASSLTESDLETPAGNEATSEFDRIMAQQAAAVEQKDDIGAVDLNDEQAVLALLEENPSAVAAELNKIEPSAVPDAKEEAQAEIKQPVPEYTKVVETKTDAALPSTLKGTIQSRIKPDGSLPAQVKEIETAAFSGNAEAQHDLAAIYIAGHAGIKQNYEQASLWFDEAAHNGIANARYNLGVLYHQGIGVKQDVDMAFQWYETAADLGHPEAQYNLGIAHIEGIGVPYNPQKAAGYFEAASDGGVMEAAYNLGLIYENGLLGKSQPDTALMWYKRASDKGSPEAKAALEQLANALGMKISDVNRLIEGMETLGSQKSAAQKKTTKSAARALAPNQQLSTVAQVQKELMALGLYPGPVDGLKGALTADAVRTYQSRNSLTVDGQINENLLMHMRTQAQFEDIGEGANEQGSRER